MSLSEDRAGVGISVCAVQVGEGHELDGEAVHTAVVWRTPSRSPAVPARPWLRQKPSMPGGPWRCFWADLQLRAGQGLASALRPYILPHFSLPCRGWSGRFPCPLAAEGAVPPLVLRPIPRSRFVGTPHEAHSASAPAIPCAATGESSTPFLLPPPRMEGELPSGSLRWELSIRMPDFARLCEQGHGQGPQPTPMCP